MKLKNAPFMQNGRRIRAKALLEEQLSNPNLEEKDITRIKKELSILDQRIINPEVALARKTKIYRGAK